MTRSAKDQLETLQQKKAQLDARITKLRAQRAHEERRKDTRRKVIAGAIVLEHCEHDADFKAGIARLFNRFLTRPADRVLFLEAFDLPELAPTTNEGVEAKDAVTD